MIPNACHPEQSEGSAYAVDHVYIYASRNQTF